MTERSTMWRPAVSTGIVTMEAAGTPLIL